MSEKSKGTGPACAACGLPAREKLCMDPAEGKAARACPTVKKSPVLDEANQAYEQERLREFARQASLQEAACYQNRHQRPYTMQPSKTRIVEICEFARRMGYARLGLAFCVGLTYEAGLVEQIFKDQGFEVVSVSCKAGATPKEFLGLGDEDKIHQGGFESMCNPVFQARLLAESGAQFNVLLGLCVGHDSMFFMHAGAPTTVLAVKDRVTGHNPLAAVYASHSYYRKVHDPTLG
ncbi:MAG: DUF1847 domain-containing protein [Pseudomonadota bacterium]